MGRAPLSQLEQLAVSSNVKKNVKIIISNNWQRWVRRLKGKASIPIHAAGVEKKHSVLNERGRLIKLLALPGSLLI